MKFLFRWAFRLLLLAIVLVVSLVLLKDTIIKAVTENRIQAETGWQVKIGRMETGLMTPTVTIENLVLYNPAEFGGSPFVDIPEFHMEYDLDQIRSGLIHLKLLRLHLRELNLVENQGGQTNIFTILAALQKSAPAPDGRVVNTNSSFAGIDTLNLSLGKVRLISLKTPQNNREFNLGIQNEIINNVRSEQDLAGLMLKILVRTGVTIFMDQPGRRPGIQLGTGGGAATRPVTNRTNKALR